MTATAPATGAGTARRPGSRALPWLIGIVALALVAIVAGAPRDGGGVPYDPASSQPSGARALVLLLEDFGAEVDVTSNLPGPDTDVAFMFYDVIPEDRQADVERWMRDGGTLVVSDPRSVWSPPIATTGGGAGFGITGLTIDQGRCDIDALRDLAVLDPGSAVGYEIPVGSQGCFTDFEITGDAGAFVVSARVGEGRLVALGGTSIFTNSQLDHADNAALATALLLPTPDPSTAGAQDGEPTDDALADGESTEVALLQRGDEAAQADGRSLTDALSTGARLALAQLLVAFLVYAWFRARRVGKPITEHQPVAIAGSELVSAVGQLMQQTRDPDRAARALRADLRRRLGERFGLGPDAAPEVIAAVVGERSGIDPARLYLIVSDQPVTTDRQLVELAAGIDDVRKEILHGP